MSDNRRFQLARLTPEEESIPDADDDDIDESLPADLWFRTRPGHQGQSTRPVQSRFRTAGRTARVYLSAFQRRRRAGFGHPDLSPGAKRETHGGSRQRIR